MIVGVGSDTAKEIRARVADLNELLAVAAHEGIMIDVEITVHDPVLAAKEYPELNILMTKEV